MARLLKRLLLFSIPFIILAGYVIYVDPFNYFDIFHFVHDSTKYETVYGVNPALWETFIYHHEPCPNVIIGDSRAEIISLDFLKARTGLQYKCLSATAAKINEIVDYFWFADSYTRLKSVYIVLNFNMFNYYAFANRISGDIAAIHNPLLYIYNKSVMRAAYLVTKSALYPRSRLGSKQLMTKDEFWSWALTNLSFQQYGKWKYPEEEYLRLAEIGKYCRKKKIDLVFIITPHHIDYQRKLIDYKLENEQIRFNKDISRIAKTYDFDYANELTMNKDNFRDPLHVTDRVSNIMMNEILSGNLKYARLLSNIE